MLTSVQLLNSLSLALSADLPSVASDDVAINFVANTGKGELHAMRRVFNNSNTDRLSSTFEDEVLKFRGHQRRLRLVADEVTQPGSHVFVCSCLGNSPRVPVTNPRLFTNHTGLRARVPLIRLEWLYRDAHGL